MIRYEIIYADERRIIQKRRPIMRKKSQKFSRFIASANCVNYRNDAIIVEKFNESVRKYKRFADINAAGDEELASEKLRDAGTDLYQSCEWALKNYLYKVAITRFENGEISNEKKGNEIDFLSMKDTNLFKLIDAFKLKSKPDYVTLGINLDTILYGAQKTNNGPKHNATVPDPNTYRKAVGEIRKIIKNYVIDADLDLIEDSIYGSQNVWYELLEETNDFSDAYHYVLVTKTISNINVKGLFSRKWDLVIDFDYDSDVTGLEKEYTKICGVVPWIRMLTKTEANRKFSISNLPYWIMANGCADDPDTIIDESRWKSKYGRYLSDVLEKFHEMYTKPVKVFIYPIDNEKNLERVVLKFIQAINGSILAESELPKLLRELKQKSMNLYNRTVPQHWLVNEGTGLSMLYSNSRSKKNAISEEEMAKKMRLIVGRISNNYVNESHAYINYHGTEIYFNPSATKGEIDKSKINQRVKFGIGFSYDGPRAYNSSIQLMGKEDVEEVRNIETGMIIKCEVIKNVAFFTQVRLVGYSEEVGSIHIDELSNPFNRNHRPSIGSVFEVKVLNQKFDNKTQRNIWMLTMNVSGSSDEEREETAMAKALKNIKL